MQKNKKKILVTTRLSLQVEQYFILIASLWEVLVKQLISILDLLSILVYYKKRQHTYSRF